MSSGCWARAHERGAGARGGRAGATPAAAEPMRPDRDLRLGAAAGAALAAGGLSTAAAVWLVASVPVRRELGPVLGVIALAAAAVGLAAGAVVRRAAARHLGGARRLAEEIDLLSAVDPGTDVVGSDAPEIAAVARSVNGLAAQLRASVTERDRAVDRGRAVAERDRQRLATVMAALSHAVLVCGADGQILLYNQAAGRLFPAGQAASRRSGRGTSTGDGAIGGPHLGLGRSAFGLIDRNALAGAVHRLRDEDGPRSVAFAAAGPGGRLLRIAMAAVNASAEDLGGTSPRSSGSGSGSGAVDRAGFVLIVEDATTESTTRATLDGLLRLTLEEVRGRLAAVTGAVEMLQRFDSLEPAEVQRFRRIIGEESGRLTAYLDETQASYQEIGPGGWELDDILGRDLLRSIERRASDDHPTVAAIDDRADVWVRTDASAAVESLGSALAELALRGAENLSLSWGRRRGFAALIVGWTDRGGDATDHLRHRVGGDDIDGLARRHGGEAWIESTGHEDGAVPAGHSLVVLLPPAEPVPDSGERSPIEDRPTVYDFSLLRDRPVDDELTGVPLTGLACTVFDLETTGLDPSIDRILSIGAVRIVNGRLLGQESFDLLVDPERPIPARSTEIHGITADMTRGQPTIAEALPGFARFVERSVLVGHNVAFDLRFLELQQRSSGVVFTNPVLDTLVLGELAFGQAESHSLESLGATLGIDVTGRHTALGDALVTAEIFLELIPVLGTKGLRALGQVLEASAATSYAALRY